MKKTAVIYARQSVGDDDAKKSDSIQAQFSNCRAYAKREDIEIIAEYSDANLSGRTYPDTQEAINLCKIDSVTTKFLQNKRPNEKYRKGLAKVFGHFGKIDFVIVNSMDRLARAKSSGFLDNFLRQLFIDNKVKPISLEKGGIIDYEIFSDSFTENIESQVKDQAVTSAAKSAKKAVEDLKEAGGLISDVPCLGYSVIPSKQMINQNDDAWIVAEIFKQYNDGKTIRAIVDYLTVKDPKKRNWFHNAVKRVLDKMIYCGKRINSKKEIIEITPLKGKAIITYNDYFKTQDRLKKNCGVGRSNDSKKIHPLSGVLKCGYCNKPMEARGERNGDFYYRCKGLRYRKDENCGETFFRETTSTGAINCNSYYAMPLKESLKPLLYNALLMHREELKKDDDTLIKKEMIKSQLHELGLKENNYIQQEIESEITFLQMKRAVKLIETKRKELLKEITVLNSKVNIALEENKFQEIFDKSESMFFGGKGKIHKFTKDGIEVEQKDLTDTDYRNLALSTFKKIYVYKYHIYIIFKDLSTIQIERICYGKGRNFPKIQITPTKTGYDFLILQKSYLQAKKSDWTTQPDEVQPHHVIYQKNGVRMITVGENDTQQRYKAEGLTYLDSLPVD